MLIGGGYIGMEVAAGLAGHSISSTVILPSPFILGRLFTPKIAGFYEKFYEGKQTGLFYS